MASSVNAQVYDSLKNTARNAPQEPGVYIWKDEGSRIIYIGKAKSLHNRLSQYFAGAKDVKTAALLRHSYSIETIIVSNEYEALLLENTLIKQHTPKYNINLKDGKTYPVIRISAGDFPRVFRTRHIVEDGSSYFGPYPNIQSVDKLLALIERLFPLRKCRVFHKRNGPCMYYHIERCKAPCCGRIGPVDYGIQVERVRKLLSGETGALVKELAKKMNEEASALKFEEAARLRNALKAIEEMTEPHSVEDRDAEDRDYIAWAAEGIFTAFSVFSMRGGRMTGRELFCSRSAACEDEAMETFITAYYSPDNKPPPVIFLQADSEASLSLLRFFDEAFGYTPKLLPFGTGTSTGCGTALGSVSGLDEKRHTAALAMARQNALEELRQRLRERGAGPALDELKTVLGLKNRPLRIEGFDIAQLDGRHPVASLVSFANGAPDRKNYRYFKLRSVIGLVDDYASMREAVFRRYSRLLKEGKELPDLVLVDGGIGQVNAARAVMDNLGIDCGLAGLAKKEEEIWLPSAKKPIRLPERSEALKVLQFVRDETHRFATGFNQRLRSKDLFFPVLESIDGIGQKRAAVIMQAYQSLEKIAGASPEELARLCKINKSLARAVKASAKLALEDQAKKKKEFSLKAKAAVGEKTSQKNRRRHTPVQNRPGSGASEPADFAAEETPEYGGKEDER
ncbi:MAG: excinuclease ABC subunit UvrC [Treponema sp.]|jgi:excinuclease ABC subunit C|nr:excinuclease ABC subunit UvrC [Treponema sp.]